MKKLYTICIIALLIILPASLQAAKQSTGKTAVAIFAGGCFWCMQPPYDKTPGVIKTVVGYTGGKTRNPTYRQVSAANTGHIEAVEVFYNPQRVSYQQLLKIFWHNIDPTDAKGQFCDKGHSYISAIFYGNRKQEQLAKASKQALIESKRLPRVATLILPATTFYPAEKYHQNYYKKNPIRYKFYRYTCGRDARLKKLWGKKAG